MKMLSKGMCIATLVAFAGLVACGDDPAPTTDAGPTDSGPTDTGPTDTGPTDTGPTGFCETYAATCGEVMTCGDGTESCALADCATWWGAAAEGTADDKAGATQGCYNYHLGVAGADAASADIHCPHAKGEAVCVDAEPTVCDQHCPGIVAAGCANSPPDVPGCLILCGQLSMIPSCTDQLTGLIVCMGTDSEWMCIPNDEDPDDTSFFPAKAECAAQGAAWLNCLALASAPPVCEAYCGNVAQNCTDDNEIDFGDDDCATACATWDEGTFDESSGNTAHCRLYHATAAFDDAAVHCPHASPSGGGVCVDAAPASFCDTYAATCGEVMTCGDNADESCALDDCATWWGATAEGTAADTSGATQGCYNYHLGVAGADAASADTHCPHAKGEAICVDAAPAGFCETYAATCGEVMTCGDNADESCALDDCAAWWGATAEGTPDDKAGATQGCYNYHLGVAGADAASADTHCPHAKGEAICVDAAPAGFCETYAATCGEVMTCGDNADESCALDDCAAWWGATAEGTPDDKAGATQGCYAYHLSVAGADAASADTHCPHAKGEAICVVDE